MRPVYHKYCEYHELFDGTYDINQIADLNEMLDVAEENTRRCDEANKKKG